MSLRAFLRGALALSTAAGLAVAAPTPAAAATKLCFGPPSQPLAFVCYTPAAEGLPQVVDEGEYVTIPGICYGIGCTADTHHPVPTVHIYISALSAGTIEHYGETYEIPGLDMSATICDWFALRYVQCHP